ncbi:MAG: hypothetical protein ACE5E0_02920, partial [Terriglobia bacterium]
MAHRKRPHNWIKTATDRMKQKGTQGSFGKAAAAKIKRAKARGGRRKKQAVFAENMKKIAKKKKRRKRARKRS